MIVSLDQFKEDSGAILEGLGEDLKSKIFIELLLLTHTDRKKRRRNIDQLDCDKGYKVMYSVQQKQ